MKDDNGDSGFCRHFYTTISTTYGSVSEKQKKKAEGL